MTAAMHPSVSGRARSTPAFPVFALTVVACTAPRFPSAPAPRAPKVAQSSTVLPASSEVFLVDVNGLGLFREEEAAARKVVTTWARRQGWKVVEVDKASRILARARAGLDVKSSERCGLPLHESLARERYAKELGATATLDADVGCDAKAGHCTLRTTAYDRLGFDGELVADFEGPYERGKPWPEALHAGLAHLKPRIREDKNKNEILGIGVVASAAPRREKLSLQTRPMGTVDLIPQQAFEGHLSVASGENALKECFAGSPDSSSSLVEIREDGSVGRCEVLGAEKPAALCACEALLQHASGSSPIRGRRAWVEIHYAPGDTVLESSALLSSSITTHLRSFQDSRGQKRYEPMVSDPSIAHWEPPSGHDIELCFSDLSEVKKRVASVAVTFDSVGKASQIEFSSQEGDPFAPAQLACVERAFLKSQSPCPKTSTSTAHAELRVFSRPPKAVPRASAEGGSP